jgi:hypothetical protein
MVSLGGDVSIIIVEETVCSFHMGMGLFQRASSSSPIKGGHIPLIATIHKRGRAPKK